MKIEYHLNRYAPVLMQVNYDNNRFILFYSSILFQSEIDSLVCIWRMKEIKKLPVDSKVFSRNFGIGRLYDV